MDDQSIREIAPVMRLVQVLSLICQSTVIFSRYQFGRRVALLLPCVFRYCCLDRE